MGIIYTPQDCVNLDSDPSLQDEGNVDLLHKAGKSPPARLWGDWQGVTWSTGHHVAIIPEVTGPASHEAASPRGTSCSGLVTQSNY